VILKTQLRVLSSCKHIAAQPDGVRAFPQRLNTKGDVLLELLLIEIA